jgi:hypothetical protein
LGGLRFTVPGLRGLPPLRNGAAFLPANFALRAMDHDLAVVVAVAFVTLIAAVAIILRLFGG